MKTQKKSSKNAVTAGVLIALYFVTYAVIGAISMPVPVLFLLMPMLVALFAAPTYHTVSYTHLTLPTTLHECRSRWSPYH